ncbi:Carnitine O-acetyltransferase mitochondrial [Coemansia sp. RSA 2337]|nr:Carnitine O-acetyltransferase mitochondrial [Coemansia sp. S680]KAJ2100921.1 Carnitine O-acetyltransferase mitochondrial [Coemansia sp. RSA 922]KAJ2445812.1 Carnitine O-acetyltransferase mitochondrial [Coemansia sp. RSA 2337]
MPISTRDIGFEYGKLFAQQGQLPRLPVPSLQKTLAKYSESLEPLLPSDKLAYSKRVIHEFGESAQGQELQRRLEARAQDPSCANWLEEWWNDLSYMGYRDPVIPYVSYHYSFNDDPLCSRPNQRAAKLIAGAMAFRQAIIDGSLPPETTKTGALCSHSYKFMFNACRIPQKPSDICRTVPYEGNDTIVVIRNAQFFLLPLVQDGIMMTQAEVERVLDRIVAQADTNAAVPVGLLTADNRDTWAENRRYLIDAGNAAVLNAIESSAFVVALEASRPVTREEFSHAIWHGDGRSRWFDKPCQFVVCDNARAGFSGEHSMMDGTPTLRLVQYVIESSPLPVGSANVRNCAFEQLHFRTPPGLVAAAKTAERLFIEGTEKQHLAVLNYSAYGKEEIKRLGCSPDAFIQLALQLAYTRLYGGARPTYESSMTRKFLHGRTETCRSVTRDSVAWCRAMMSLSSNNEERISLFQTALATHTRLVREAVEGQGVDRHLLGLRMVLRPEETKPEIFEDPAYAYSSHWYLSTSQVSSENFTSYGWSEVTPKGYGVAYNIRKECLIIHIACMRNEHALNSDHLAQYLETALNDVRNMLLKA